MFTLSRRQALILALGGLAVLTTSGAQEVRIRAERSGNLADALRQSGRVALAKGQVGSRPDLYIAAVTGLEPQRPGNFHIEVNGKWVVLPFAQHQAWPGDVITIRTVFC